MIFESPSTETTCYRQLSALLLVGGIAINPAFALELSPVASGDSITATRHSQPDLLLEKYGPTQAGDTLWSIASAVRPDTKVTIYQMLSALYQTNPNAFINDNIDLLKINQMLSIPKLTHPPLETTEVKTQKLVSKPKPPLPDTKKPSTPIRKTEWVMEFPALEQGKVIAFITASSDGTSVSSVSNASLRTQLADKLSPLTLTWLEQHPQDNLTLDELAAQGISLEFQPQSLEFTIALSGQTRAVQEQGLGKNWQPTPYSSAAFWTQQNTFNFNTDYRTIDQESSFGLEWLGALNVGGIEGANLTWQVYGSQDFQSEFNLGRGATTLFFDRPNEPTRLELGDVTPGSSGHLTGAPLGGIRWHRSFNDLQPSRDIRNSASQPLDLSESAEVDIYVNDLWVSQIRLSPGRYNLGDLPMTSGSNDVRLEISYQSGRSETLNYSQFFNADLLQQGLSDFDLSLGFPSQSNNNQIEYQNSPLLTSYYQYGLSDSFTLGGQALYHENAQLIGLSTIWGTDWGNIDSRLTYGHFSDDLNSDNDANIIDDEQSQHGGIFSLAYSQKVWGAGNHGSPNLRAQYERQQNYASTPWESQGSRQSNQQWQLSYNTQITDNWDTALNGRYLIQEDLDDQYSASLQLNWSNWGLRTGLGVEYKVNEDTPNGETLYYASLNWNWNSSTSRQYARASYDTRNEVARTEFGKNSSKRVGEVDYSLGANVGKDSDQQRVNLGYTANRWQGQVDANRSSSNNQDNQQIGARMTTSLAWADGHFGWGRSTPGPVTIVDVHSSLKEAPVHINRSADRPAEAIATSRVSGLSNLGRGHTDYSVNIDAPDAPLGYDLGNTSYNLTPGSLTGHIISVGSDATMTVIGTLVDSAGEPIPLSQGTLVSSAGRMAIFTNRGGRFVAEGIAPGQYKIEIPGETHWIGEIYIPENDDFLQYLPVISLEEK